MMFPDPYTTAQLKGLNDMVMFMRREQAVFNATVATILFAKNICTQEEFEDIKAKQTAPIDQLLAEVDEEAQKEWLEDPKNASMKQTMDFFNKLFGGKE